MLDNDKQKQKRKKNKLKEKKKLLRSNKYICSYCGFIGKPHKVKKGSWIFFFIKLIIVTPIILIIIALSMIEGLIRGLSFSTPESVIWDTGFEKFFPGFPYTLANCPDCKSSNSMKKLCTRDGRDVYERFERDHFLVRR